MVRAQGSSMSVTLRQLEAFRHVWTAGSLKEAASAMSVTHSAVQRLISQLETEMGERLFERDGGKAVPTEAAVSLSSSADRVMGNLDRITALAQEKTRINGAALRIGALTSFGPAMISTALTMLRQRFQNLRVSIDVQTQANIEAGFARGDYDVCFVVLPLFTNVSSFESIGSLSRVCILPHGHHLASREVVTPSDLSGERFISIFQGSPTRRVTDSLFKMAGVDRILDTEARSSAIVCSMVARGLGVSIVASHYAEHWSQKFVVKPFKPEFRTEYAILRSDAASERASVQGFIEASKAALRNLNDRTQLCA